ncbi:DUF6544 family protein [Aliiroseovarius sp. F20344]|uniref:DUF6544 family protein n=1 Tax=Aliiroseovarius sp. F20344 TaxID=2926414 RepID=UPI001FF4BB49|nr:DUF6544 family protein [Aliiroseovarius sp. F20344]MCK0141848.1 hypothetical protein [Aliiroseovarius sp. F20344]
MKTFGLILLLIALILLIGQIFLGMRFAAKVHELSDQLRREATGKIRTDLPEIVAAFAQKGMVGDEHIRTSHCVSQDVEMRLSKGADWQPITARQIVSTTEPGFVWSATMRLGPVPVVRVLDRFVQGVGELEVRLLGAWPMGRETGAEADRGEAMRYLSELPWFPDAILANHQINWQQDSDDRVDVSLPVGGKEARVTLLFNAEGDIVGMQASNRLAKDENGEPVLLDWRGSYSNYAMLDGRRVPITGEVGYVYSDGYEGYWRGRLGPCQNRSS